MKAINTLKTVGLLCLMIFISCSKEEDVVGELDPQQNNNCTTGVGSCTMVEDAVSKAILNELNVFRADPANYKFHNMNGFYDVKAILKETKPLPKLELSEELCKGEKLYLAILCYEYKFEHNYKGSTPLSRAKKGGLTQATAAEELLFRHVDRKFHPKSRDINALAKQIVTSYCNDPYDKGKHNLNALIDPSWKYVGMSYAQRSCMEKYYYGILLAK
ncbi:hypothetical protein OAT16_04585 [Prolixibacteraceae bacterium]|nr:hypothetical protein [Prolixibacteraceae bacterium]